MPVYVNARRGRFNPGRPARHIINFGINRPPIIRPVRPVRPVRPGHNVITLESLLNLFEYGHINITGEEENVILQPEIAEDEDDLEPAVDDLEPAVDVVLPVKPPVDVVLPVKPEPDPGVQDVLKVESIDFQVAQNVKNHHTDQYDITEGPKPEPQLVVRRGQEFTIKITFTRPYQDKVDDLRLVFETGDQPKPSKGTHVEFILSDKDETGKWGAKLDSQADKVLTITVFTPPDCIVSKWKLMVDVVKRTDNKTTVFRYNHKDLIYILFNPWCEEDAVYMENAKDREAYVLNDKGQIYTGSENSITKKPWVYGQFTGNVLDCCLYLLQSSDLQYSVRGNPIPVARKLTAMINTQNDGGVLVGNWSGDYSGGKSPLSWTGSAPILEQFYEQKFSVMFGQCWVFAGVLTTVCRALGIPARTVTNFASAHDTDTSITIDVHYDEDGNQLTNLNEDSVWNFHVWNEAWMSRPDLPAGYGGWQTIDATPQETSDGVYCCGPCPVRAIRSGEVNLPFDGTFIFAEVNADRMYWVYYKDGKKERVHLEKNSIGKQISTMSVRGEREDITKCYKFPEDSEEERMAVLRANLVGSSRKDLYEMGPTDVKFELRFDPDNTFMGSDFVVTLSCSNNSQEKRTLFGLLSTSTMYYTGVVASPVGRKQFHDVVLQPNQSTELTLTVSPTKYQSKLKDCCMLSISAMARVDETKQVYAHMDTARLRKPHLHIKAPDQGKVGEEFEVTMSFTNPMPATLTDCYLEVEGPGLTTAQKYPQGDVISNGTFLASIKLKPKKAGPRQIIAIFTSRQLEDVNGSHDMNIIE